MNTTTIPFQPHWPANARHALRLLQHLQHGTLHLELPDGSTLQLGQGGHPHASICLHDWQVFGAVLRSGDIGLAEGYIDQHWSTPHLADLLRLLMINRDELESLVYGAWWGRLAYRLRHLLNRNTRTGSRRKHPRPLRLGQRFLPAVAGPEHELLVRLVPGRSGG
jgi:cyclopropane-fatty-acyl-phospholipid synthase